MIKTVLVTGGAGYVGSHACKALAASGYLPVTLDNLVHGHKQAVKWGPLEIGDINDSTLLDGVIAKYRPEAVLHFAAYAYVGESVKDPAKYFANNVAGSITLLDSMRKHGIRHVVYSSSCSTYGIPGAIPISETHPLQPVNPYGSSKMMVEQILGDFDKAYGIRHVSLRYFNAAGADPDGEIGENHDPETHLIPLVLGAVFKRQKVSVYGTDYPTRDGTCVRDYIHVADLAEGHVLALKYMEAGQPSIAMNLGTGVGSSVAEVIKLAERVTGSEIAVSIEARRPGDPPELVADPRLAERLLGWKARYPDLDVQILHAWSWIRSSLRAAS